MGVSLRAYLSPTLVLLALDWDKGKTDLKLSAYSPEVIVKIPRNACGFFEFWRAKELTHGLAHRGF